MIRRITMGIWGVGLYDNDCTADIRDAFQLLINDGVTPQNAAKQIKEKFRELFSDVEDGPWAEVALNEQLLSNGALTPVAQSRTLLFLKSGADITAWENNAPHLLQERKREIERLIKQFSCSGKKLPRSEYGKKKHTFDWQIGQLFAVPISGKTEESIAFQGEYILLYVCGEEEKIDRYRVPKVYVKITKRGKLPQNSADFNALEYVQISCTAMKERFLPFSRAEDIPNEYQQQYCPDSWGYLPEFTMVLYEARNNHPPESIIHLGSFENIEPPKYDYRRYKSLHGSGWTFLEEFVIARYNLHNLRKATIYNNKSTGDGLREP